MARHEQERLSAFLDDELSDEEALEVARHVASCAECLAELEGLRAARDALRALPTVRPPAPIVPPPPQATARWWRAVAVGLCGGMLLVVGAWTLGGEGGGTVAPPVDVFVADHVVRVTSGGPFVVPVDTP